MAFLNNVNISKKLTVGFAVVVTVVAVMCAAVFASLMSIKSAVALNNHAAEQVEVFNQALMARVERQNAIRGLVASGDPAFAKKAEDEKKIYDAALVRWAKIAPEDAKTIDALKTAAARLEAEEADLVAAGQDVTRQAEAMMMLGSKGRLNDVRLILERAVATQSKLLAQRTEAADSAQAFAITLLAVGSLLAVALSVLMGAFLSAAIAKPVSAMTNAMGKLAARSVSLAWPWASSAWLPAH